MRNLPKYLDPNRAVCQQVPLIIVQKSRIKFCFRLYYGKACCLVISYNGNCPVPSCFARDDSKLRCPYSILRNDVKIFNTYCFSEATQGFKIWTSFLCSINKTIDDEKIVVSLGKVKS